MKNIVILGAGRSATVLIQYALDTALKNGWTVVVADSDLDAAIQKVAGNPAGKAVALDALDPERRQDIIRQAGVVVSLLPPHLHTLVARDCLHIGRHLVTASYLTPELKELDQPARQKGLIFMGEMGLDPGIDHMSAMEKIHEIQAMGGRLTGFQSHTGGLIAPESDDNPWHYKFTWNPRNVVLAGQGTAQYLENGQVKYLPYSRLFKRHLKILVEGLGEYEVYANRDSLPYRELYGLQGIPNLLRGTIRASGFCEAWNALAQIGLTDASYSIPHAGEMRYCDWLESYLPASSEGSLQQRVASMIGLDPGSEPIRKMEWLGLFGEEQIPLQNASPALILENLLLKKWALKPGDKDMIIMQHRFDYELAGKSRRLTSTLVMKGKDESDTAMARLVGLPLGIFAKLVLEGAILAPGVHIPVDKEVYQPVLAELAKYGVTFVEKEEEITQVSKKEIY
jgi:saccharopine dehydrogenase-like NADP-dependent oxidoreductase